VRTYPATHYYRAGPRPVLNLSDLPESKLVEVLAELATLV